MIAGRLTSDLFDEGLIVQANRRDPAMFEACEVVLKGPEVSLGGDRVFMDKDGHPRSSARVRWWDPLAVTLRDVAEIPGGSTTPTGKPSAPASRRTFVLLSKNRVYRSRVPVAFGHYWRTGPVNIENDRAVCVDFSAVKKRGGKFVAYRWDGEPALGNWMPGGVREGMDPLRYRLHVFRSSRASTISPGSVHSC